MKLRIVFLALSFMVLPVDSQTLALTDRTVTSDQLRSASRVDLPTALRMWFPEVSADVLVLVDGVRLTTEALTTLSVSDVESARLVTDAGRLAEWGIDGGHGLIELTTAKPARRALSATYRGHYQLAEKTDNVLPTRNGHTWLNQVEVSGSDSVVGYLASLKQLSKGYTLKDDDTDQLALRAYIFYNTRRLRLSNDLTFDHQDAEQSTFVRYSRPESLGSFHNDKIATIADRFSARLLTPWVTLQGDFGFVRRQVRQNEFLSPQSGWFGEGTDVRQRGSYEKGNRLLTTYEGGLLADYSHSTTSGCLDVRLSTRLFSGTAEDENYAGMGVLSDRMGYISFTLGYDTLLPRHAARNYERTWRNTLSLSYEHRFRYGVSGTASITRSSLLAPDHKWEVHYQASAWWHLNREPWFKLPMRQLTLGVTHGVSGYVDFSWQQFTTTWSNRTDQQYVYNYYQTGATLNGLANSALRPARNAATQVSLQAGWGSSTVQLRYVHSTVNRLLNYGPQPLESGFLLRPEDDGKYRSDAFRLCAESPLVSNNRLLLTGQMMLGFEQLTVVRPFVASDELPLHPVYGQASLCGSFSQWKATAVMGGNRDLGQSTLELGYSFSPLPAWLHELSLTAAAANLVSWHGSSMLAPERQYTVSLLIGL